MGAPLIRMHCNQCICNHGHNSKTGEAWMSDPTDNGPFDGNVDPMQSPWSILFDDDDYEINCKQCNRRKRKRKRRKEEKPPQITRPSKMNALKILNITKQSVDVRFDPPNKDGFALIDCYQIQIKTEDNQWKIGYEGMPKKCSYTFNRLQSGTTYHFRIRCKNDTISSYSKWSPMTTATTLGQNETQKMELNPLKIEYNALKMGMCGTKIEKLRESHSSPIGIEEETEKSDCEKIEIGEIETPKTAKSATKKYKKLKRKYDQISGKLAEKESDYQRLNEHYKQSQHENYETMKEYDRIKNQMQRELSAANRKYSK